MKSSQIKFIRPQKLNSRSVSSWFTLQNQNEFNTESEIPGLNLGNNTNESESIISNNRNFLLKEIGVSKENLVTGEQVHKNKVRYVRQGGLYQSTDAFVTDVEDLALAIQVADCAAILLADESNRIIGASHAGWRGAVNNIVPKTIRKMIQIGAQVKDIKAFISPCISLGSFEVGEEVAKKFPPKYVDRISFNKPHVDLKKFIRSQMLDWGMDASNIELSDKCTMTDKNLYSYRRQQNKSGRMMGIIKINS